MKKKKEPDPTIVHTDFFKSVKVPLQHVLKNPDINIKKIYDTVVMANKIVSNTLMFMKLYILHYYKVHNILPPINKEFINSCMKILCTPKTSKGRKPKQETKDLKDTLTTFYNEHYRPLIVEDVLEYTHMNTILDYLTTDILTMYENNIKLHYSKYVERYVNIMWKKKFFIDKIRRMNITSKEKTSRIYQLTHQLKKIKNDLLTVEDTKMKSFGFYHEWIIKQRTLIRPNKVFAKNNLFYDIECDPFDYLPNMMFMMTQLESEDLKMFNVFPLRSEIVPKHLTLDTTTLIHLLMTNKQGAKSDYLREGNLKRNEDKIWAFFFRTERQCFKKNKYSFHHMIETDGVSCSILLIRKDLVGLKNLPKHLNNNELYLDQENIELLQNKKIIAIDPGLCDLIYCTEGSSKDSKTFRYSQDQRRKETKSKKYSKIILEFKKEIINGLSVIDHETEMSNYNKKTLSIENFKEYIFQKSKLNHILEPFYNKYIFRKLKLNGYLNIKKSEQRMINNFKKIFDIKDPKDVLVCFGDFEQKQHMKFKEPTKGVGFRKLFRANGFKVYLVDEFRTSCRCSNCCGETAKFMVRTNPKPYKDNSILVHGLLRCKNECRGLWNRDRNGSSNIYKICNNIVSGLERPLYLSRSQSETLITTQVG